MNNLEFSEKPFYGQLRFLLEKNLMDKNISYSSSINFGRNNMSQDQQILRQVSDMSTNANVDAYIDDPT